MEKWDCPHTPPCIYTAHCAVLIARERETLKNRAKDSGPLLVGQMLYGYCGGHFGRDSYEDKRIEALGADWVVCRDAQGQVHVATFCEKGSWTIDDLKEFRIKLDE